AACASDNLRLKMQFCLLFRARLTFCERETASHQILLRSDLIPVPVTRRLLKVAHLLVRPWKHRCGLWHCARGVAARRQLLRQHARVHRRWPIREAGRCRDLEMGFEWPVGVPRAGAVAPASTRTGAAAARGASARIPVQAAAYLDA